MLDLSTLTRREKQLIKINPGVAGLIVEMLLAEQFGYTPNTEQTMSIAAPDLFDHDGNTYQVKTAMGCKWGKKRYYRCSLKPSSAKMSSEEYIALFDYFIFVNFEPYMERQELIAPFIVVPASELKEKTAYTFCIV